MDFDTYIQFGLALILVLGLMGLLAFFLRKINNVQSGILSHNRRIKIVEQRMIDTKHKVVLIRCDHNDHLVILSQNGETVIKTDINPPAEQQSKSKENGTIETSS